MTDQAHPFDLMIIQNSDKSRVLTIFDSRWGMFLFPYRKMTVIDQGPEADQKELSYVTGCLAELLRTPAHSIHAEMSLRALTEKYSVSDKVSRLYDHRFFKVSVDNLNEEEQFELAGTKFKWWRISDLEADSDTIAHNSEIVAADDVVVAGIAADKDGNGSSVLRRLDEKELRVWLEDYSLGDLWRKNILGGGLSRMPPEA
jgi:hypothetical protein